MVQIMVWIRCDSPVQLVQLWVVRGFTTSWYFILRYTLIAMVRCTAALQLQLWTLLKMEQKNIQNILGPNRDWKFNLLYSFEHIGRACRTWPAYWRHLSLPFSASLQQLNACLVEGTMYSVYPSLSSSCSSFRIR